MTTPRNVAQRTSGPVAASRRPGRPVYQGQQPWNGPRGSAGQPIIKGVSALDAAKISQDARAKSALYPGSVPTSAQIIANEQDRQAADKIKRQLNFSQSYERYARGQGMGVQPVAVPIDPVEAKRKQLVLGGIQPNQAAAAVPANVVAPAPARGPVAAPVPAIPAAPVVKPQGTITGDDGKQKSMASWIAAKKNPMAEASAPNPAEADADAIGRGFPSADKEMASNREASSEGKAVPALPLLPSQEEQIPSLVADAGKKMSPEARATGGPVWKGPTSPTVIVGGEGSAKPKAPISGSVQYGKAPVVNYMKKGGPVKKKAVFKVGEKGPEVFMPSAKKNPPAVIGTKGPQVGTFPENGTVIPNQALMDLKQKFSKMPAKKKGKAMTKNAA